MDANLQRPFQLANREDWQISEDPAGVYFDAERRALRLTSARERMFVEDEASARQRLERAPGSCDRFGTHARWDAPLEQVLASGAFPGTVPVFSSAPGEVVSDVAIGFDSVLYLAVAGRTTLVDLRRRWDTVALGNPELSAWRLAPMPSGGAYVLDRAHRRLWRVTGLPLRTLRASFDPDVFRPVPEDEDPPRVVALSRALLPVDEEPVAIAVSPTGRLALLTWVTGADARLRILQPDGTLGAAQVLTGVRFPFSLAFVEEARVAVLISAIGTMAEALVFPLLAGEGRSMQHALPVGDVYPLREHLGDAFLHGTELPPVYPTTGPRPFRRLLRLASPAFRQRGRADNARPIDSGTPRTVWHRLYVEANLPPGCGARIWLAATEVPSPPLTESDWHEHRLGVVEGAAETRDVPHAVWQRERSEIPFHPGMLGCPSRPGECGLFSVLVQRAGRRVRTLEGRYLWLRAELLGDGRSSPELAALRVYAPRRSYTQYLPELYRESVFGPEADDVAQSTRPDFLERFLSLFESMLTPLESRVRDAHIITTPSGAPSEALDWLASWIGFVFVEGLPEERKRQLLAHARELYTKRGTLDGLRLSLDLATGGAVTRGKLLVVEDFRLRRAFATILGAELANEEDPLLPGLNISGNSLVGDTLFLGDESAKEFLAVFGESAAIDAAERDAIAGLFDRLAHRVTVLVHSQLDAQDLRLVNTIVRREVPAHVDVKIVNASQPFLVGVASLLGVDTFVEPKTPAATARVEQSALGAGDTVAHLPSLDPRLGNSPAEQPVAGLATLAPPVVGRPFSLDGNASRAAPGRRLVKFHWTLLG